MVNSITQRFKETNLALVGVGKSLRSVVLKVSL